MQGGGVLGLILPLPHLPPSVLGKVSLVKDATRDLFRSLQLIEGGWGFGR